MPPHYGKFIAYFRVSTDRQGKSGLGLPTQEALASGEDTAEGKRRRGETEGDGERAAHPASAGTVNYCAGRREGRTSALRVSPLRGL
jgi:hypothetical protein